MRSYWPAAKHDVMRNSARQATLVLLILLAGWRPIAHGAEVVTVKAVSVHLLLTPSGELSPDVSVMKDFKSWNFAPLAEGFPGGERFYSFLVKVRLDTGKEAYVKGKLGSIEVKSKARNRVLFRKSISGVYFPREGEAVEGFFVQGSVCEPVLVTASTGTSRITKELNFECGE